MNSVKRLPRHCWFAFLISLVAGRGLFAAGPAIPTVDGDWWSIAPLPDLGKLNKAGQQTVDFAIWQAADGTWQLWSCIRKTSVPGRGRLLYAWEAKNLTDAEWTPQGIAMEADPSLGETEGGLQAPYVLKVDGLYYMFYGDWERICLATSHDGKKFERIKNERGQPNLFAGPYPQTRDPMVVKIGGLYYCYYSGNREKGSPPPVAAVFCRTSADLRHWSEAVMVSAGGDAVGRTRWHGGDAECPFVVEHDGLFYLFRNQRYGVEGIHTEYASPNPLSFGVNDDRYEIGTMPAVAPEIIHREAQDYIASVKPGFDGIRVARLKWMQRP
jgi:hypothetical protein